MNLFDLTGKTAVVTGALGFLGQHWCDLLRRNGANVYGIDFNNCDVTKLSDVADSLEDCLKLYGEPDIVVNNAAYDPKPADGQRMGCYTASRDIMNVNLFGVENIFVVYEPAMKRRGKGNIVNIGSMLGFISADHRNYDKGYDKPYAYGASKAALWNLTYYKATRLAECGVVVNMLALSGVENPAHQSEGFKQRYIEKIPIKRMLRLGDFDREFLTCVTATVPYDTPLFVGGGWTLW